MARRNSQKRQPAAVREQSKRALVASAAVMSQHPEGMSRMRSQDWQDDAWQFYDSVGELRFGIGWLANGMSRVNLVPARQPKHAGDEPAAIVAPPDPDELPDDGEDALDAGPPPLTDDEELVLDLVGAIAGGSDGQGQLLAGACVQLSVPGVGYLLAEEPNPLDNPDAQNARVAPDDDGQPHPVPEADWSWRVLAQDELRVQGDQWEVATGQGKWRKLSEDSVLIRFWRSHPRRSWEPDSPCRAVRPTLRQISLLDQSVEAVAQSRLAGAGLLIVPSEAEIVPMPHVRAQQPGVEPPTPEPGDDAGEDADDFVQTIVDTMTIPIGDRGSAAAVVPLTLRIPGEYCDKVNHITFWGEFNGEVLPLREAAVKRLALGLDMPPEVLTGMSGMNHWGAWQVEETAITLHIEPMAEIICHALTIGYLRPALRAAGMTAEQVSQYMVWYDTTDLTTSPDRSDDAIAAYNLREISGSALRRELGLSEDDKPSDEENRLRILLDVAKGAPTLAPQMLAAAGILEPAVAEAADEVIGDEPGAGSGEGPPRPPRPPRTDDGPPDTRGDEPAGLAAAGNALALLEACDGLVFQALSRAGAKLRSAAGKRVTGGPSAIDGEPASLHTKLDATDYAQLDYLLDGSWGRLPLVAVRYNIDADALRSTLDAYTRALIATGHEHDIDRLADALGLGAGVR